jgi:hypothetical protein
LLDHVADDTVSLARALVFAVLAIAVDLKGRVALNALGLAEIGFLNAIDLGQLNVLVLEGGGSLLVVRGEGFAMSTPWRKELDEDEGFVLQGGLEGRGGEGQDI